MNESPASASKEDKEQPARRGTGLSLLAMFLALISLGGTGWLWWQGARGTQGEATQFATELNRQREVLAGLDARSAAMESQVSALAAMEPGQRLTGLEQGLVSVQQSTDAWKSWQDETAAWTRSMQAAMEDAQVRLAAAESRLSALSVLNMDGSGELDLAEVDYLLRLAQERLALFADTRTADRALEIADLQIAAFDNPMYIGLRNEIALARQKLSQLKVPDYQALDRQLDLLQSGLPGLTFKGQGRTFEQPADPGGTSWWVRIRNAFASLVTVRRSSGDEMELPVLADRELIRQRAWLELEVARLAALRRDRDAFAGALNRFSGTLERWFEPSGPGGQEAMAILRELKPLDVDPPMPDISAPWTALRALRDSGAFAPSQREPVLQGESPPRREPAPEGGGQPVQPDKVEALEKPQAEEASAGDAAR